MKVKEIIKATLRGYLHPQKQGQTFLEALDFGVIYLAFFGTTQIVQLILMVCFPETWQSLAEIDLW